MLPASGPAGYEDRGHGSTGAGGHGAGVVQGWGHLWDMRRM